MTVENWLAQAVADVERRGLPELRAILQGLASAMLALRRASFDDDARR